MIKGSKEWLEKYATDYTLFLEQWRMVSTLNRKGDYSQGWAVTNGNGDYIILNENRGQ